MLIGFSYDLKDDVVLGGTAADDELEEYDSADTVNLIASGIEANGHTVIKLGGGRQFLANVMNQKVDLVFNISEGRGNYRGREAQVPSVLEMLGIPYTGSDPQCLAICLDKSLTKKIVRLAGITTPQWRVVTNEWELADRIWEGMSFPVIVKPVSDGSSKGIRLKSVVYNAEQATETALQILSVYHQPVMFEEYIKGPEITVGIVGNAPPKIMGTMAITMKDTSNPPLVYSLEVKRNYLNTVDYTCPAPLPEKIINKLTEYSLKAFKVLDCRDFARIDFRIGGGGIPYFIEINPLPGLGNHSDLVIMALKMGLNYEQLISSILDAAIQRCFQCTTA